MFGFKRRAEQRARLAQLEEAVMMAGRTLDNVQVLFDEKTRQFTNDYGAAALVAEAKKYLGGCVYPGGPCGCSCQGLCQATWPEQQMSTSREQATS
jgi:hypothetical protein